MDIQICPFCGEPYPLGGGVVPHHGCGRTAAATHSEFQSPVVPSPAVRKSNSNPQLLGNALQPAGRLGLADELMNMQGARTVSIKQRGRPPKKQPMGGGDSSPPSNPDHGGADSNGFSTASEAVGG